MSKLAPFRTFTVEGTGNFPIDMLRFDRCVPSTESDAHKIEHTTVEHTLREKPLSPRQVNLRSYTPDMAPTAGRWESFGWKVIQ